MMKKTASILLILFLFLTVITSAEEATPVLPQWELPMEDGYPAIINRCTDPEAFPEFSLNEDAEILHIWVANTRDTDAILLQTGTENWMIDCTEKRWAPRVVAMLEKLNVTHIDKVINSHPHHDHLNGICLIDDYAEIDELAICFPEDVNDHMINAMLRCSERGINVTHYGDGTRFSLGEAVLDVHKIDNEQLSMNDQSAVIRLQYGERSMLFTGDAETAGQIRLLESAGSEFLQADILKYPHHGKLKLNDNFYAAVSPSLVVVTNAKYSADARHYLKDKHVPTAYSAPDYVHLMTDGQHWIAELSEAAMK